MGIDISNNITMGNGKITGLGAGTAGSNDAARMIDLQNEVSTGVNISQTTLRFANSNGGTIGAWGHHPDRGSISYGAPFYNNSVAGAYRGPARQYFAITEGVAVNTTNWNRTNETGGPGHFQITSSNHAVGWWTHPNPNFNDYWITTNNLNSGTFSVTETQMSGKANEPAFIGGPKLTVLSANDYYLTTSNKVFTPNTTNTLPSGTYQPPSVVGSGKVALIEFDVTNDTVGSRVSNDSGATWSGLTTIQSGLTAVNSSDSYSGFIVAESNNIWHSYINAASISDLAEMPGRYIHYISNDAGSSWSRDATRDPPPIANSQAGIPQWDSSTSRPETLVDWTPDVNGPSGHWIIWDDGASDADRYGMLTTDGGQTYTVFSAYLTNPATQNSDYGGQIQNAKLDSTNRTIDAITRANTTSGTTYYVGFGLEY